MGYYYNANKSKPWLKARWRLSYRGPDGKLINEKGASTEAATAQLLKMREKDVANGRASSPCASTTSGGVPT
jgi:hypothetical protein